VPHWVLDSTSDLPSFSTPNQNGAADAGNGTTASILAYRQIEKTQCCTQIRVIRWDVVGSSGGKLRRFKQRPILDVVAVFGQVPDAVEAFFVQDF
jgi:hypothetical protein